MKHKWQVLLLVLVIVFLGLSLPGSAGEQKRAVTVDDMLSFKSVDHPVISPDGKKIAFTVSFYPSARGAYMLRKSVCVGSQGEGAATMTGCQENPSAKKFSDIYIMDIDGKNMKKLTAHPNEEKGISWSPDSKKIYFLYGSHGVYNIKAVPVQGGEFRDTMVGRYVIREWDLTPDGKTFIVLKGDDENQNELYSYRDKWKKLTAFNDSMMKQFYTQPVEEIWVQSEDDAKIQAFIIKPVGFEKGKKYPMILSIHGVK